MKKILPLFLLCIFLFNTVGYYIVFKVAQVEARKEIKSKIEQGLSLDELTEIKIDNQNLKNIQWIKKDKEFYHNNELFDIVKIHSNSTSTTFYCITDEKEHELFSNLDEHITTFISGEKKNDSHSKKLAEHVVKIYFNHTFSFQFQDSISKCTFATFQLNYLSESPKTCSPPPEFV